MEKSHDNDDQLIAEYLAGDEDAFTALVKNHLTPVYSFVYRLVGDARNTEDITQETFLKAWKHIRRFRPGSNFKTWLFTIAHRTAVDFLRKKKDLVFSDFENDKGENALLATTADSGPLPDEKSMDAFDAAKLEEALVQLPPLYREVLLLHYHNHLTFDAVAGIVGKPLNTVKSQHRRALLALRGLLNHMNF